MPRRSRWSEVALGVMGLVRLGLLLIGVPVALVALVRVVAPGSGGVPWPAGLPGLDEVGSALSRPGQLPSATLIKVVALVGWIGWLELSLAVVVDVVARTARRRPWRIPLPLAGHTQGMAGRLVASAALISALWWQPVRMSAALPAAANSTAPSAAQPLTATEPTHPVEPSALPPLSPGTKVHQVRSGDWLSKIAQVHLGSWRRYPEIAELNRNRLQPDGDALVNDDLIRPGWVLVMPDDAIGVDVIPASAPPPPAPTLDEAHVVPAPSTTRPSVPTTSPPTALVAPAPAPTPVTSTVTPRADELVISPDGDDAAGLPGRAALFVGVPAMVAAAVMWKLWGLRQAQQRRRRRGRDLPKADPALEPVERQVRAVATADAAQWLDLALRDLGTALADTPVEAVPVIEAVRAGSFGVEILLDRSCPSAPPRFVAADGGRVWRLEDSLDLGELKTLAGDGGPLVPSLLTVGTTPDGPLLIDLERAGTLSVEGDAEAVAAFLAGAALELASAPWSAETPVRLIGGDSRLAILEQVELIEDPAAFAASPWVPLDRGGAPTTLAGRVASGGEEGLPPTVLVAAPGAASHEIQAKLAARAEPGTSGLVLVAAGPIPGAAWRLFIEAGGAAVLEPLGVHLRCAVDAETVEGLVGLLAGAASNEEGEELRAPARDETSVVGDIDPDAPMVRVLGPVEVPWATPPPRRTRSEEIVAYLATHFGRRVPRDRLRVAVHPLRDDGRFGEVAGSTFRAEVSRVRNALGRDDAGQWRLPTASREGYQIGIDSDWTRFTALASAARSRPPAEAIGLLRKALTLIRGRPFEDVPEYSYGWAWSEQVVSAIEVAIAEAAEQLADVALAEDDPCTARWAARQGLLVIPSREALYQAWMRAAAAASNYDDLEQAWREVWRAVQAVDPLEEPRPDTVRLYKSLRDASREVLEAAGCARTRTAASPPGTSQALSGGASFS